jgi:uncharacterized protein involved in type VI secretion and phage assembly
MQTLYQGIVTENYNEENKGRLKVKIPLMDADSDLIVLVNLTRGYATKNGGFFFIPEIDDIVIVGFLGNDFERGVILGTLFEKDNTFHNGQVCEENNNKVIASRCNAQIKFSDEKDKENIIIKTPKGNTMILDDEKDKEKITIKTPKGQTMIFDDENEVITLKSKDGTEEIKLNGKDGHITLKAKEKLTITCGDAELSFSKNGDIKATGAKLTLDGKTIEIKSSGAAKISGQSLELKSDAATKFTAGTKMEISGMPLEVKSNSTAKFSATAKLEVSSSAITEIKGTMVKING